MKRSLWLLILGPLCACTGSEDIGGGDGGPESGDTIPDFGEAGPGDSGDPGGPGDPGPSPCGRETPPEDYARKVIVSHPYDEGSGQASVWEVWELGTNGELTTTGESFTMGRTVGGTVGFTGDGEIGLVAQEDGTLGVFRLGASVEVLETGFGGDAHPFYAGDVVVTPDSRRALVIDGNWRENGGGIYGLRIECDGSLIEEGRLAASKLAATLGFVPGRDDRAVVPARDILDSTAGKDLHLLAWDTTLDHLAGAESFGDSDSSFAGFALTPDGRYALLGDNNEWYAVSNRVAVVEVNGDSLVPIDVLLEVNDPVGIVTSPFNDAALVLDGYGNGLWLLSYDSTDLISPFVNQGEPTYTGASPQLPSSAVVVQRGSLIGLVLVAENLGVRRVQFEAGGTVTDLGLTSYGPPIARIVGALGVQP